MAGFILKALSGGVRFVDMAIINHHMFGLLTGLVEDRRLSYYTLEGAGKRRMLAMNARQAALRTQEVVAILAASTEEVPDVGLFETSLDLGDLHASEYARLHGAYLGSNSKYHAKQV